MRWLPHLAVSLPAVIWMADPGSAGSGPTAAEDFWYSPAIACKAASPSRELPVAVRETSGLAWSRSGRAMLWTHNDSGNEPVVFALDTAGTLLGQVRVTGATLTDWEDLATGPCTSGTCLYIADIGDNARRRDSIAVWVVPEPGTDASHTAMATMLPAKYPDGAQDAEAIFVLPGGDIYLVTKGRHREIALYRFPKGSQRPGVTATLERVRSLWPRPRDQLDRVTGATASPDGRWVAVRTYRTLHLFALDRLIGEGAKAAAKFDLTPLREKQGESVALTDGGEVWLTTEAERRRDRPALARLRCVLGTGG